MKSLLRIFLCLLPALPAAAQQATVDSTVLMNHVRELSDDKMKGRKAGTAGNRMAQFYILDKFRQIGLQPYNGTFEYPFYFNYGGKQIMGTNLYGYIPGTESKVIVISAHYDHLGTRSVLPGQDSVYNGADDNASGVAALLSLMAYYKAHPPRYTLLFVAFDAEEMGLQGARAFVQRPPVPVTQMKMNLNMDMVSRSSRNELYVCGTYHYPALKTYVQRAATGSRIKLLTGHDRPTDGSNDWTSQSDHQAFHAVSIPFLYLGVEDHPDYHRVTDEYSRITYSFYYQGVNTILSLLNILNTDLPVNRTADLKTE